MMLLTPKHLLLIFRSMSTCRRLGMYPGSNLLLRPPHHGQVSNERHTTLVIRCFVHGDGNLTQRNVAPLADYRDLGYLVYKGKFDRAIRFVRIVLFLNFASLLPLLVYALWRGWAAGKLNLGYLQPMAEPLLLLSAVLAALHYTTRGFITELHFNPDTKVFTATELTFFTGEREFRFKAKDVGVRRLPVVGPALLYKGRTYVVGREQFRSADVYNHLMGLQWSRDGT